MTGRKARWWGWSERRAGAEWESEDSVTATQGEEEGGERGPRISHLGPRISHLGA